LAPPAKGKRKRDAISAHADLIWVGSMGDAFDPPSGDDDRCAVVLDHKTGQEDRLTDVHDTLQLGTYAIGTALLFGTTHARAGYMLHAGAGPNVVWGPLLGPADLDAVWVRVLRTAKAEPVAAPGAHCDRCWSRKHCPQYMLPAYDGGPKELAPFMASGNAALTPELAVQALNLLGALKNIQEMVSVRLEAYADEIGGIPDGKGRRWVGSEVSGRRSADVASLEAAGLTQYVKQGQPYRRYGWRKG
jgi:hypothetical protein